jgi:nucleoside-diphosphate-sugar epimerase
MSEMRAWMMCPKCGEGVLVGQLHTLEKCRLACPRAKENEYQNIDFVCSELVYLACDKCGWELDVTGMTHEDTLEVSTVQRLLYVTKPNVWRNTYSITKVAGEEFVRMYHETAGLDVRIVRPYNVYGPLQHIWRVRKAVPTFILAALMNRPLCLFGDGQQTVDLIHVEDLAKDMVDAMEDGTLGAETLDIGSGRATTVLALAQRIIRLADSRSEILHLPMREGETEGTDLCAGGPLVERRRGDRISLERGLRATIQWYRANVAPAEAAFVLDSYGVPEA